MSALPKKRYTMEEYLALEEKAEYKSEYFNGEIFAMAGAAPAHSRISSNLNANIHQQLKKGPCYTLDNDTKVKVERTGLVTYPDVIVVCGKPKYEKDIILLTPTVLAEVLSASTEKYDRTVKVRHYQQIESLQELILVAQDEAHVEQFVRQADGSWRHSFTVGLESTLVLASIPISIPLTEVYDRVLFPDPGDQKASGV